MPTVCLIEACESHRRLRYVQVEHELGFFVLSDSARLSAAYFVRVFRLHNSVLYEQLKTLQPGVRHEAQQRVNRLETSQVDSRYSVQH